MLRQPYGVGQPFHRLETGVSAGMGTASEEPLGLYREGDPDGASGVTGFRGLLDLPEALGTNHDGKATTFVDHSDSSPDHLRPSRRTEKALREPEGRPSSTPYVRKSLIAFAPATGANCTRSMCTRIPYLHLPAP